MCDKLNDLAFRLVEEVDVEVDGEMHNLVEVEEWEATFKGEARNIIFDKGGKHYLITQFRYGSPFTDWHYEANDEMIEVYPETVSKIVWKKV